MLGEDRLVVSNQPGTTRDPVDTQVMYQSASYILTDTAGIRRRGRIDRGVEGYSVVRCYACVRSVQMWLFLLLDGAEGVTEQDTKIAGLIQRQGRGCVLMVNKWDLRSGDSGSPSELRTRVTSAISVFWFCASRIRISLESKNRVPDLS